MVSHKLGRLRHRRSSIGSSSVNSAIEIHPGHPGNLDQQQQTALNELWLNVLYATNAFEPQDSELKERILLDFDQQDPPIHGLHPQVWEMIRSDKASRDKLHKSLWTHIREEDPDVTMCRYLRARKFAVDRSLGMLLNTIYWRVQELNVDELLFKGDRPEAQSPEFIDIVKRGVAVSAKGLVDKSNRPMLIIHVHLHNPKAQTPETVYEFAIYAVESLRCVHHELLGSATIIFDMSSFSLSNMDWTVVKFIIHCLENYYPEFLGNLIIHDAPWVFQGIWSVVKGWLDPVVVSKVHFTRSTSDLQRYIEPEKILSDMGGKSKFHYKYVPPNPSDTETLLNDAETRTKLQAAFFTHVEEFEGYIKEMLISHYTNHANHHHGHHHSKGVDTEDPHLDELKHHLLQSYTKLDPYVRAKSVFERMGSAD